ncbi:MAG: hypothetical protein PHY74_00950 [Candidatus Bathyarchaeota archaeon]|nr:hypothetical protein [Candidatus Bathyarchaeota archaeon]MDD4325067.1 hypothetical protein [Candidatus Bathyarchaeota archaeon]MDI9577219.1 hypothetical protein [Thermoproteota archaeon]
MGYTNKIDATPHHNTMRSEAVNGQANAQNDTMHRSNIYNDANTLYLNM